MLWRLRATSGCSLPKQFSRMARAFRRYFSALS
jgi:hypothetical protein